MSDSVHIICIAHHGHPPLSLYNNYAYYKETILTCVSLLDTVLLNDALCSVLFKNQLVSLIRFTHPHPLIPSDTLITLPLFYK